MMASSKDTAVGRITGTAYGLVPDTQRSRCR